MLEYVIAPAVVGLFLGVILLFLEHRTGWFVRQSESRGEPDVTSSIGRGTQRRWVAIFAIGLPLVIVLGVLIGLIIPSIIPNSPSIPLEVQLEYDFEDRENILQTEPWGIFASEEGHVLTLSNDKRYAYSGSHSLRLDTELRPGEYVGVKAFNLTQTDTGAVTTWMFMPASEQVRPRICRATLTTYGHDSTRALIGFRSESRQIEPGVWTLLSVRIPSKLTGELASDSGDRVWDGGITEMYLAVSCDMQYSGPIFVDDVITYAEPKQVGLDWKDFRWRVILVLAVVCELALLILRALRLWLTTRDAKVMGVSRDAQQGTSEVFTFTVDATKEEGLDTKISLQEGQQITILGRGQISINKGHQWMDPDGIIVKGRDEGEKRFITNTHLNDYEAKGVLGALIGWVGEERYETSFLVGKVFQGTIQHSGNLHLGVNDQCGTYADNTTSGGDPTAFRVTVMVHTEQD